MALQVLDLYPDQVRLVYHHYPDQNSELSRALAESLEFAADQDKFWEMHDRITDDVPDEVSELVNTAEDIGLDKEELVESLNSGEYTGIVSAAKEEAQSRGVGGIALFTNDTEYMKYPGTLDDLIHAIDEELKRIAANDQS